MIVVEFSKVEKFYSSGASDKNKTQLSGRLVVMCGNFELFSATNETCKKSLCQVTQENGEKKRDLSLGNSDINLIKKQRNSQVTIWVGILALDCTTHKDTPTQRQTEAVTVSKRKKERKKEKVRSRMTEQQSSQNSAATAQAAPDAASVIILEWM